MSHDNEVRQVSTSPHSSVSTMGTMRLLYLQAGAAARVLEGIKGDRAGSGWRQPAAR